METGITYIDIILAVVLIAFIVTAIIIDTRSAKRNRKSKKEIQEEIHNRMERTTSENNK